MRDIDHKTDAALARDVQYARDKEICADTDTMAGIVEEKDGGY